jgi:hypothetical protein
VDGGQPTGADPCSWPRVDPWPILTECPVPARERMPHSHRESWSPDVGRAVVFVAESVLAPPGPIPNPVVTQGSAGEYCGGDPVGGEAAADTTARPPAQPRLPQPIAAGWSSGSSLGS